MRKFKEMKLSIKFSVKLLKNFATFQPNKKLKT